MQLMPALIKHRIWAGACIIAYHSNVSLDYVVSRDHFTGLLGMTDEFECLRCNPVMQIHTILHDAYSKLKSEYGIGPGYCYPFTLVLKVLNSLPRAYHKELSKAVEDIGLIVGKCKSSIFHHLNPSCTKVFGTHTSYEEEGG